jgi:hypothetical protein
MCFDAELFQRLEAAALPISVIGESGFPDMPVRSATADLARNIGEGSFAVDTGGGAKVPPGGWIVGSLHLSHEG